MSYSLFKKLSVKLVIKNNIFIHPIIRVFKVEL